MNIAPPPYSPCPTDLGERLESHGRYVQSLSGSVRIGRRLQLERVDFDAVKLTRRNLRQAHLAFCRLSCSDLRESSFLEAELHGCDLTAADLTEADFAKADLRGADLSRAVLSGTKFDNAKLGPYHDGHTDLGQITRLHQARITGASFNGAMLTDASFEKANLQDTSFAFARLENVSFRGADLRGANFALSDLGAGMADAIEAAGGAVARPITAELLDGLVADHAAWIASDGARGKRARLRGLNLSGANLAHADLSGADLAETNLACADLSGAKLICTDLRGANLSRATIDKADFRGAMLDGAFGFMPVGSL